MTRPYRVTLRQGQTSPLYVADFAIDKIKQIHGEYHRALNILDIGCGSGEQMNNIINRCGQEIFNKKVGLDWSPSAVARLNNSTIYNQVKLCQSSQLPFANNEFDIAISIENLEHLYADDVKPALKEMMRVAKYIIVITPNQYDVINHDWLGREIPAATNDQDPIDNIEYQILEGAVHKSVVLPQSMGEAGFEVGALDHGRYFAESNKVNLDKITVVGIDPVEEDSYELRYQQLLKASLGIDQMLAQFRT